ncbi:MAG: AAA family ATPase [Tissierella sp.]|nr:AAA family ATPase [Tissierella sp.]
MYIKSYKCTRFAGLKDATLEFDKGINVILGPNESGKSTIIEGIHSTLFKGTKLRRNNNVDKDFSYKFMPKPNGDFIDGKVVLELDDGEYEISKEWGSSESVKLLTPGGNIIKNENDVNEELSRILDFGESTYSNIVFAKQRQLKEALYNIISNNELTKEINDLLRMTLMELDGISIDSIQQSIEDEIDTLYKRWDRAKNNPENNRGINNPYKTGLGKILESYYTKENLRLLMDRANRTEQEFDEICNKINELKDKKEIIGKEKSELEKIEEDVNNRAILDAEIKSINKELEELMEANSKWPTTLLILKQLEEKSNNLRDAKDKLNTEKANIDKVNKRESLEKKLKSIDEIQTKIDDDTEELSRVPAITKEDIDRLTRLQTQLLTLETTMKASKMIGRLINADKQTFVSKDFGEKELLEIDVDFEANGLINISYGDEFEIEIKTGDIDFEELNNKYVSVKEKYDGLLNQVNIDSIETGRLNLEKIKDKENNISSLNNELNRVLDNSSREELENERKELADIKVFRDLIDIEKELKSINSEEIEILADKRNNTSLVEQWEKKYTDHDSLFDLVIDERTKLKEKENKLKGLQPLPEEFETIADFKSRLVFLKNEITTIQSNLDVLNTKYYEAKNNLLDDTYEELKKEYLDAEKAFDRNIKRGEKLLKIQRVFLETKERLAGNPMETLINEFSRLLTIITDGSYKTGEIDEEFNIKLENSNGEIPIDLLSAGTYDCVSLALRFSLLRHIFSDRQGYVVLDDCLVDLDPIRKDQAISLINDFAKDYQIIFTTCSPETAEMLGGKIIEI